MRTIMVKPFFRTVLREVAKSGAMTITLVVPDAIKSYRVIVHEAEEGGYWGEVLKLPGCVSQGETIDEFRDNIREALEAVLECQAEKPDLEIYTEPTPTEKEFIQFGMQKSRKEKTGWVGVDEPWTATAATATATA